MTDTAYYSHRLDRKKVMNWLRSALFLQSVCEINGCNNKADYCITKYLENSIVVCKEHFDAEKILVILE